MRGRLKMLSYTTKSGKVIDSKYLSQRKDWSEQEIAQEIGISRMQLYKIRRLLGCIDSQRSDKGSTRVDPEVKRLKYNAYMRSYYRKHTELKRPMKRIGDKTISVARFNAAIKVGRVLKKSEIVHHVDGNVKNNQPDNLMVFKNQKSHLEYHNSHNVN